jgi:hypothetical protein
MKSFLFDVAVLLGQLFMACFYLLMIVVAVPFAILAAFLELMDGITKRKSGRSQPTYSD